jgi:hypothetical protein
MTRAELEHVIRAAADIASDDDIVVLGSQAILGVSETTAVLPAGWRDRLIPIRNANTRGVTGWCLEAHDLVIAKAVAGREKDRAFLREAMCHGLVDRGTLLSRLAVLPVDQSVRDWVEAGAGSA